MQKTGWMESETPICISGKKWDDPISLFAELGG